MPLVKLLSLDPSSVLSSHVPPAVFVLTGRLAPAEPFFLHDPSSVSAHIRCFEPFYDHGAFSGPGLGASQGCPALGTALQLTAVMASCSRSTMALLRQPRTVYCREGHIAGSGSSCRLHLKLVFCFSCKQWKDYKLFQVQAEPERSLFFKAMWKCCPTILSYFNSCFQ